MEQVHKDSNIFSVASISTTLSSPLDSHQTHTHGVKGTLLSAMSKPKDYNYSKHYDQKHI